jgi:hypothetical protein
MTRQELKEKYADTPPPEPKRGRGRPKGAKDNGKRQPKGLKALREGIVPPDENLPATVPGDGKKRAGGVVGNPGNPHPVANRAKGSVNKKDLLLVREIEHYGFKTFWEVLQMLTLLQKTLKFRTDAAGGYIPKDDKSTTELIWQINDLLKLVFQYQYPKLKAYEINTGQTADRVVLNFQLGMEGAGKQAAPPPDGIMDMVQGPEGFTLPDPT